MFKNNFNNTIPTPKNLIYLGVTLLSFAFLFIFPSTTFAAQTACAWTKTTSGGWTEPANWSCGVVPNGAQYDVTICNASAASTLTVTATTTITVGRLTVGSPYGAATNCNSITHTLDVNGEGLTIETSDGWQGAGNIHLGTRGRISAGTGTWTVKGNFYIQSAGSTATGAGLSGETSTFVFTTGAQEVSAAGGQTTSSAFYNITIAPAAATTTFGGVLRIGGVLTASGGGMAASTSAPTITLSGTAATPFVKSTSYFEPMAFVYSDCTQATRNIAGGTYTTLTLNTATAGSCVTATSTMLGDVTVTGDFTLNGPGVTNNKVHTFDTGGYNLSVTGTTKIGGATIFYYPARIYITGDSTVTLTGDVDLLYSSCSACTDFEPEAGIWVTNGNTVNLGGNLNFSDYAGLGGGITIPFYAGTGTVQMVGTGNQYIYGGGPFYNLTINNTASDGSNNVEVYVLDVDNNLTLTDGALNFAIGDGRLLLGGNLTINDTASTTMLFSTLSSITFDGTTTFTDNLGNFNLGDVYVASSTAAATLTLGSSATSTSVHVGTAETLNLGSYTLNLTNTTATTTPLVLVGSLTPGTGTVKYKGTSSTIAPALYYNLNTENAGKLYTIAASSTVTNNLTNTAGTLLLSAGTTTVLGTLTNSDTIRESTGVLSKAATSLALDDTTYSVGETMTITLVDQDGNTVGTSTQTTTGTTVTISSGADSETLTLTETGNATYTFTGTLPIANATASANDGTLQVSSSGTITVAYVDPEDYTDTAASDTASITIASSGGGSSSSSSSSSGGGAVLLAPYNPGATVGNTPQTPTTPTPTEPASPADPLASIRAIINPIIATLLTGPIQLNTTNTQNRILQFLLAGDKEIYPEGLITGYYGPLTKAAVQRFQLKYGVTTATDPYYGYAGPATRAKVREVLGR